MEPCKYCKKTFKHVSAHVGKCPARLQDSEIANMTACRYCKKMFKRVSAHDYRCPENPDKKTRKTSSDEEVDGNEETTKLTACRYCKKMFKRVSAHDYRCPENPDRKTKTSSDKEVDGNEETTKLTACRYCKKMFKRVSAHDYRCPENPDRKTRKDPCTEEVNDVSGRKSRKGSSSKKEKKEVEEEKEEEEEEEEEGEELEEEEEELEEEEEVDDNEVVTSMLKCSYCKKKFGLNIDHYGKCPDKSSENIQKENVADSEIHFTLASKYIETDKFFDQSENRSKFSAASPFSSSPNHLCSEYERNELPRPPIHGDYDLSHKEKKPARRFYPKLDESIPNHSSPSSYESWEIKSGATARDLKRPPIHNNDYLQHKVDIVSDSGRSEDTLLDSSGNSFYQLSDSEDSFVYLNQDLKRPPIHKNMSSLMKNADKKQQHNKKEEEFWNIQCHISRE